MTEANAQFGIPTNGPGAVASPVPAAETPEARIANLRAKADAQAASEFNEDAVYAQLLAEARAKQVARLAGDKAVEFPLDTQGFPADYDRIKIFRGQNKQDQSYVPLGVNGFVIKVPRDEEVIVPHEFTVVLENAIEEITIQSQGGLVTRPAHRFPFSMMGKATTEQYKAFQVAQRDKHQRQLAQAA